MAQLIISTVCRHRPASDPSGYLYQFDTEARCVVGSCPVPEPPFLEVDPNPRGGLRGARGIAIMPNRIAISHHCEVFLFDDQWRIENKISHPSCGSIHDIAFDAGTLLVASARNDLAFRFSQSGELLWHWNARGSTALREALPELPRNRLAGDAVELGEIDFRDPRTHDYETYNRTHLNAVCMLPDGDLLVLLGILWSSRFVVLYRVRALLQRLGLWQGVVALNRGLKSLSATASASPTEMMMQPALSRSVVVRVSPDGRARLVLEIPETTTPSHTLLVLNHQQCVVLNTTSGTLMTFEPDTAEVHQAVELTDGFLRGAAVLDDHRLALGSQGDLLIYDLEVQRMIDSIRIIDDPNEAIYCIQVLPEGFAPLPPVLSVEPQ